MWVTWKELEYYKEGSHTIDLLSIQMDKYKKALDVNILALVVSIFILLIFFNALMDLMKGMENG